MKQDEYITSLIKNAENLTKYIEKLEATIKDFILFIEEIEIELKKEEDEHI